MESPILPVLERMRAEQTELMERMNKLSDFRLSPEASAMPHHHRDLLAAQATAMAHYYQILRMRTALMESDYALEQMANTPVDTVPEMVAPAEPEPT